MDFLWQLQKKLKRYGTKQASPLCSVKRPSRKLEAIWRKLWSFLERKAENLKEVYHKALAERFSFEKKLIVKELQKVGIQSILTPPEKLTINALNKYLEIKTRGLI